MKKKDNWLERLMLKRMPFWILCFVILMFMLGTISFGWLVQHAALAHQSRFGRLPYLAMSIAKIPSNLNTIYERGFFAPRPLIDRFPTLSGFRGEGVEGERYFLLTRYDGDLSEGIVELIDLRNFEVLHTWNPDIDDLNDRIVNSEEFPQIHRDGNNARTILVHPALTSDGGLVFKTNDSPLRKIDICSNLIWQNDDDVFHHSTEIDMDGNIWVPASLYPSNISDKVGKTVRIGSNFIDDAITKVSPDGDILFQKSVAEIFIENDMEYLLFSSGDDVFVKDPVHLNEIQPVNKDGTFWKKGDVFLSLAHQSMIILYRPESNRIIWVETGKTFKQHDVNILDDHRITIFNNNSKFFYNGRRVDRHNEIMVYDFKTDTYSSYLKKSMIREDVRTLSEGRGRVLPNGDLLVQETDFGRKLYFNTDGSVRFTYVNRAENGTVNHVGWSRILYTPEDIKNVRYFLENRRDCDE